ncbi:MAG: MATE family efflux transporter [Erysipelotrichaceae bacterium]|nr:MATE family efflux transporter [Erysipelotrichaceae bacterium]
MNKFFVRDKQFYLLVLSIALPVALQQVVNLGVNLADQIMIGSFGETQISACSLANQFYFIYNVLCLGISGGACVLTAQYWGANNKRRVKETITLALWIAVALSILFSILSIAFPMEIMSLYTKDVNIMIEGSKYLRIMAFVYLIHGTALIAVATLRTVGVVKLGLLISCISFFVNIFFNYVFIFGEFGFPRLEIAGAALGTFIARLVEFLITFGYMMIYEKELCYRIKDLFVKVDQALMKEYIQIGSPVIVSDGLLTFGNNALAMIMGRIGASMVSANAICSVIVQISTVFINGVSSASGVITGNTIGRGESEKALEQGYTFFSLSVIVGIVGAVIVALIHPYIIGLYNITEETIAVTNELMWAVEVIIIFQCIQGVMTKGVLRGGGDTKFLMYADILFLWIASIPLGYLTGLVWGMSPFIVYICLKIDFIIKSFWCLHRLHSKKWIKVASLTQE